MSKYGNTYLVFASHNKLKRKPPITAINKIYLSIESHSESFEKPEDRTKESLEKLEGKRGEFLEKATCGSLVVFYFLFRKA